MKDTQEQLLQQLLEKQKAGRLSTADRLKIAGQIMPEQAPCDRIKNVSEVAVGYTETSARLEAMRCLQCKNAPCIEGCPVAINIPRFVADIAEGDFGRALAVIKQNSLLPAVCGRVCPQEVQCQQYCTVGKKFKDVSKAVSIGRLERFVADCAGKNDAVPAVAAGTGKRVAVIGSGPGGIVAAADLARAGHDVTVFEAFHKTGGVMVYGIPEFRLPKKIVHDEIAVLEKMGVKIVRNFVVGRTLTIEQMMNHDVLQTSPTVQHSRPGDSNEYRFDAVYIGVGAGLPSFMGIEGESLVGVYSANEYLTRANLMRAYDFGKGADTPIAVSKRVGVVGGGNVAMDTARTAIRLGAQKVLLLYRRTEKEMPARVEEVHHAKQEGVEFHTLVSPKKIFGDKDSHVTAVECLRYRLGEPDESGRRRPIPVEGSQFTIDVDTMIIAIGNIANPLIRQTTAGLQFNKWGNIVVDEDCRTSLDGIYAGGDIVSGAATVIQAMGHGRTAAAAINRYLAQKAEQ